MDIRTVEHGDLAQLLTLYRHLNPDDTDTDLADAKTNLDVLKRYPGSDIFIGCLDNKIVATCTLIIIPNLTRGGAPYALIENVVTHASHRNKGYGKLMLQEVVQVAWRADCYKVMLLTGSQRPEVHRFYLGAGFEQNKTGFQVRRGAARK